MVCRNKERLNAFYYYCVRLLQTPKASKNLVFQTLSRLADKLFDLLKMKVINP